MSTTGNTKRKKAQYDDGLGTRVKRTRDPFWRVGGHYDHRRNPIHEHIDVSIFSLDRFSFPPQSILVKYKQAVPRTHPTFIQAVETADMVSSPVALCSKFISTA